MPNPTTTFSPVSTSVNATGGNSYRGFARPENLDLGRINDLNVNDISDNSRIRVRGQMRTYVVGTCRGMTTSVKMPSKASIERAFEERRSSNSTPEVDLDIVCRVENPLSEYGEFLPAGTYTGTWKFMRYRSNFYVDLVSLTGRDADGEVLYSSSNAGNYFTSRITELMNSRDLINLEPYFDAYGIYLNPILDDHVSKPEYVARFVEAFESGRDGLSWVDSFDHFKSVWTEAKSHAVDGVLHPPVSAKIGNLAIGDDTRGRSFGVEIEVDFPDDHAYTAKATLAQNMYRAGLSRDNIVHGWHYAARVTQSGNSVAMGEGYTDARNGWTVEFDRSVDDVEGRRGCEIVSPVMYDSEQTWDDIKRVCDMVTDLGGKITVRHGLHVNLGAKDFSLDVASHYRLVRLSRQFDDVLIRMAHNPEIGKWHRGRSYCAMDEHLRLNSRSSLSTIKRYHSHMSNINLDHVPAEHDRIRSSTRVEFRIFDGSIDVGRIQAYVRLAMGMVCAAIRGVDLERETEAGGHHRGTNNGRRLAGQEWEQDSLAFRTLVDTIFSCEQDKISALYCYAASRWQRA